MDSIIKAVVEVVNSPTRPPALYPLARIKYPGREIQPIQRPNGTIALMLAKYGWEYKHRGPRPKIPHPANVAAIRDIFNAALPDGFTVTAVEDNGTHITLILKEEVL